MLTDDILHPQNFSLLIIICPLDLPKILCLPIRPLLLPKTSAERMRPVLDVLLAHPHSIRQATYRLEVLWFRARNRFRNRIFSFFQEILILIPIPIQPVPTIDSRVESIQWLESALELESGPLLESVPIIKCAQLFSKRSSQTLVFQQIIIKIQPGVSLINKYVSYLGRNMTLIWLDALF